jgi:holo-[acyl-carrier protein] synthase
MVIGLGTDLIEIPRIRASIERFGDRFTRRIFTAGEIAYCEARNRSSAASYAARFAAKEAAAKALGTGISYGVSWQEIEVRRLPGRAPTLHLSGRAAAHADHLGVRRIALSLTHERSMALAVVIMED